MHDLFGARWKTIGIVGGVGPLAGVDVVEKIMLLTPANSDQDHAPILLHSIPGAIPDRSDFLLGRSAADPRPPVVKVLRGLINAGAEILGIACNTLHAPIFFQQFVTLAKRRNVTLLNMVEAACEEALGCRSRPQTVGVLCTTGTYASRVYHEALTRRGVSALVPSLGDQHTLVHQAIYAPGWGIKGNVSGDLSRARTVLIKVAQDLVRRGAQALILGCTEIPIALDGKEFGVPVIDANLAFAKALLCASSFAERRSLKAVR